MGGLSSIVVATSPLQSRWAAFYRKQGWNPLPSRTDAKKPPCRYACYWDEPAPASLFEQDWLAKVGDPASNIQVVTGIRWGLAVIDLDGPDAIRVWSGWLYERGGVETWISAHTPETGQHWWFTLPEHSPPARKRVLWEDTAKEHTKIELFLDNGLIVAPPSRHVRTGAAYRFRPGFGPRDIERPAIVPDWVLAMPDVTPKFVPTPPALKPRVRRERREWEVQHDRDEVLASIPCKLAVAQDWGVRLARPPRPGWNECYRITREERNPSASISAETGRFWEPEFPQPISLFDVGVMLGHYSDWSEAANDLGERFHACVLN